MRSPRDTVNLRNAAGIVLLAAAAGASYYWSRPPASEDTPQRTDVAALPGYQMRGAKLVDTDELGRVEYRIHADSLAELPDGEGLAFEGVRVEYTPADRTSWSFSANRATGPRDRSRLELEGEVTLRSTPLNGSEPIEISTSRLTFTRSDSLAATDQPVEVRRGRTHLKSQGLRAHLNADKLELESVHGRTSR